MTTPKRTAKAPAVRRDVLTDVKVTKRHLAEYILDPANPNAGSQRGDSITENSIEQFGAARSGVVDKDGVMRAGNHTAEQLMAAGIEDVIEVETDGKAWVVVRRTDMDDSAGKKYALYDNRSSEFMNWDADVLAALASDGVDLSALFDADELIDLGIGIEEPATDPGAQVDKAEELQAKWQVQRGDMWAIGRVAKCPKCGKTTDV